MIQMSFAINFRTQIKRTRASLYDFLEKAFAEIIDITGGKNIAHNHQALVCMFDENRIGFWLDLLYFLEKTQKILQRVKTELFGYVCVLGSPAEEDEISLMLRALGSKALYSGIWCGRQVRRAMESFVSFAEEKYSPLSGAELGQDGRNYGGAASNETPESNAANSNKNEYLVEVRAIKEKPIRIFNNALYETVSNELAQNPDVNTCLMGNAFIGKRESLRRFIQNTFPGTFPLTIRFKKFLSPVACFVDALTPYITQSSQSSRHTSNENSASNEISKCEFFNVLPEDLAELHSKLFKERLRREASHYVLRQGLHFVQLLIGTYRKECTEKMIKPVLILENIQNAGEESRLILFNAFQPPPESSPPQSLPPESSPINDIRVFGTYSGVLLDDNWNFLFSVCL